MTDEKEKPRGVTGAEADALRASVRSRPRSIEEQITPREVAKTPAQPKLAPLAISDEFRAEVAQMVDEGKALLESDPPAAHALFEKAHRRFLNDERAMSYFGLTLVLVEHDRQRGLRFCEEAVRRGPPDTELYTNLARALIVTRNKEQAVRALKKAQDLRPDDPRVGEAFIALGIRRRPPIAFLPRSFFLNRWIGRLTWRLSKRSREQGMT